VLRDMLHSSLDDGQRFDSSPKSERFKVPSCSVSPRGNPSDELGEFRAAHSCAETLLVLPLALQHDLAISFVVRAKSSAS